MAALLAGPLLPAVLTELVLGCPAHAEQQCHAFEAGPASAATSSCRGQSAGLKLVALLARCHGFNAAVGLITPQHEGVSNL